MEENIKKSDEEKLEKNKKNSKKNSKKKSEEQYQKFKRQQEKGGKKCKISGIVAAIAGGLEFLAGLMNGSSTNLCLGLLFICMGYLYYNLGKKYDNQKDI